MTSYQETPSQIPGAVLWSSVSGDGATRVLPDGCVDLLWMDGDLWVAGPDTEAKLFEASPGTRVAGLRFAPGSGPRVIGVPAHELRDQRLPLAAVWPSRGLDEMRERAAAGPSPADELERLALTRVGPPSERGEQIEAIVAMLARGGRVAAVAAAVGLSARQLQRVCLDAFGYGPKMLARILRMQRSLELARTGISLAETATRSGFADQAHLARDVKSLAGVSIGQLVS